MQHNLQSELEELQRKLLRLGGMAESMLRRAVTSVLNRDADLAHAVIQEDDEADALEIEIEEQCIQLIGRHQPAASDLRFLVMVLKINRNIERMADKSVGIAQRSLELIGYPPVKPFTDLPRVVAIVQEMVKDALDAFVKRDAVLAKAVRIRDDEVDAIYNATLQELLTILTDDPKLIRPGISILLMFRHLERIGDLASNIGEEVYYLVEGDVIRHSASVSTEEHRETQRF